MAIGRLAGLMETKKYKVYEIELKDVNLGGINPVMGGRDFDYNAIYVDKDVILLNITLYYDIVVQNKDTANSQIHYRWLFANLVISNKYRKASEWYNDMGGASGKLFSKDSGFVFEDVADSVLPAGSTYCEIRNFVRDLNTGIKAKNFILPIIGIASGNSNVVFNKIVYMKICFNVLEI